MIGRIAGRIEHRGPDHVLIDVRGVGYIVYISDRTLAALPAVGEVAALYTDLLVREDLLQLFGFPTMIEKEWHRLLMSVQGIGAKASMAILGALGAEGIARAIALGDAKAITVAPGVGQKIAQRVVLELKAKAPAVMARAGALSASATLREDDTLVEAAEPAKTAHKAPAAPSAAMNRAIYSADALSALVNLGYNQSDAAEAVAIASDQSSEGDTATLVRAALKHLAPKG